MVSWLVLINCKLPNLGLKKEGLMKTAHEYYVLSCPNRESHTSQNSSCAATCLPSHK